MRTDVLHNDEMILPRTLENQTCSNCVSVNRNLKNGQVNILHAEDGMLQFRMDAGEDQRVMVRSAVRNIISVKRNLTQV